MTICFVYANILKRFIIRRICMKKFLVMLAVMAAFSAALFADVALKKLDNGKVEVTFTIKHPTAKIVKVAGSFTNWQDQAKTMKKEGDVFTYSKVFPAKTVIQYKFIADGAWLADKNAPAQVDDGFGGKNGQIDIKAMLGE